MSRNKKLLLVNDDMVEMSVIKESLHRRGIDIIIVGSVEEAHRHLQTTTFDLIISDIDLNGKETGLDLVKQIRKTDKTTKVFIATGYSSDLYREQAYQAGANLYIEKPMDMEEHIYKPLLGRSVMQTNEQLSLRKAFHSLGNRLQIGILVPGLIKTLLKEHLKQENISPETKDIIDKTISDLANVEKAGKEADDLNKKIKLKVYEKVNPDEMIL